MLALSAIIRRMIVGTGIDAVDVVRIERFLDRHGPERLFTAAEIQYCAARTFPAIHFAARFAAKEAVMKVLGTGWSEGVGWHDIEVAGGDRPTATLTGGAALVAARIGMKRVHLSLSHTDTLAVAQAVGEA